MLSAEVIDFLTGWLDHPVLQIGQQHSAFLNGKGVCR